MAEPTGLAMKPIHLHRDPRKSELEASLAEHLKSINATLDPHEQLDCLVVVTAPWSVENGFITPTFKVKRNRIEEAYAASFERWTSTRRQVLWIDH